MTDTEEATMEEIQVEKKDESETSKSPAEETSTTPAAGEGSPGDDNDNDNDDKTEATPTLVTESTTAAAAAKPTPTSTSTPTPTPYLVDTQSRSETHGKLRAYEARRRSAYSSKLESSSLYWRSFRDLLHASVHETARAERLVLGSVKVNQTYAQAMQATYEDVFLDDRGNPVTDIRKQKRLQEQRMLPPDHPSSSSSTSSVPSGGDTPAHETGSGMLSSLIDSQCIIAKQFGDNASHVSTEIVSEISVLRHELQTQVKEIEELGNAIIAELEIAETEVEEAWDAYYSMAMKVLGSSGRKVIDNKLSGGSSDGSTPLPSPMASSPANGDAKDLKSSTSLETPSSAGGTTPSSTTTGGVTVVVENCNDVWVVEMRYRVAVAYQSMAWEKGSSELSKLFSNMKQAECARRVKLREVLIAFLNRQERLFLSLPSIQTPVLKDLVGRQMDRDSIEQHVQNSIRARAQYLQTQEQRSSSSPSKTKKDGPGLSSLSTAGDGEGDYTLESPLMSELLCKTKVLEVKRSGMMSHWKTVLAVVTADCFLHLFDLPAGNRVQSGSAPEVAFHSLVPAVQVPSAADTTVFSGGMMGSTSMGGGGATSSSVGGGGGDTNGFGGVVGGGGHKNSWSEHLSPSESLVLPNCTITVGPNQSTFEMVETVTNKGASKVFGKNSTRKLMLRAVTREETLEWIAALKAQR
eukprot:CAMPEP_0195283530 /NCGR_PEP_ID=MMETSP0707-20130614/2048_1 /TAXON_ID=33640 /ORGANISM="Asterionellopsis glacialis, Strain CCMP134" /LENGTH=691 /DNA_ID=CAMNT_0040342713 /DNA_START=170 /DNA_END=2245 /DNA_ORIENTATION=+